MKNQEKTAKAEPKEAEHIKELTDTLQRLQADFDNYRKAVEKQHEHLKEELQQAIVDNVNKYQQNQWMEEQRK